MSSKKTKKSPTKREKTDKKEESDNRPFKIELVEIKEHFEIKENVEIKQEVLSDDELEFQFKIEADEYFNIVKKLRSKDDDLELIEEQEELLKCKHEGCTKMFKNNKKLSRHKKQHDSNFCHLCGIVFTGNFKDHLKNHSKIKSQSKRQPKDPDGKQINECDICGKVFKERWSVRIHKEAVHIEKQHECQWCFKKYKAARTLEDHIKLKHTAVMDFICDYCGKECETQIQFDKHLAKHADTEGDWKCTICVRSFFHQSTLSRHNRQSHTTTRVYQCHLCRETFRFDAHLKRHLLQAHKDEDAIQQPRLVPTIAPLPRKKSVKTHAAGSSA